MDSSTTKQNSQASEVFDLSTDVHERNNIAAENLETVERIRRAIANHNEPLKADTP
jgi:hypothetical protein